MTVTVPAYAKINLFLDIVSVREDKYHNILSLMQSVSLYDRIIVELYEAKDKSIEISCDRKALTTDTDNLAYKAAALFPVNGRIKIHIEKRIPISAGLAGGSTDAAAVLIALNGLTGNKLSKNQLKAVGAQLGADVPFCIESGAALVEGIGDIMTPTPSMPAFPIVIAKKGEGMSTPAAYRALDEKFNGFADYKPRSERLDRLIAGTKADADEYCKHLFNVFEEIVEKERPSVTELKSIMQSCGAAGQMMSGSGTSVFGIFKTEREALAAKNRLMDAGAEAHLCYPIER